MLHHLKVFQEMAPHISWFCILFCPCLIRNVLMLLYANMLLVKFWSKIAPWTENPFLCLYLISCLTQRVTPAAKHQEGSWGKSWEKKEKSSILSPAQNWGNPGSGNEQEQNQFRPVFPILRAFNLGWTRRGEGGGAMKIKAIKARQSFNSFFFSTRLNHLIC